MDCKDCKALRDQEEILEVLVRVEPRVKMERKGKMVNLGRKEVKETGAFCLLGLNNSYSGRTTRTTWR